MIETVNEPEVNDPEIEKESRRIAQRRLIFTALFFLGTVLAGIGWMIEWKGLDHLSPKLGRLVSLAIVGHALQVVGAFGNLVTPDGGEGGSGDEHHVE